MYSVDGITAVAIVFGILVLAVFAFRKMQIWHLQSAVKKVQLSIVPRFGEVGINESATAALRRAAGVRGRGEVCQDPLEVVRESAQASIGLALDEMEERRLRPPVGTSGPRNSGNGNNHLDFDPLPPRSVFYLRGGQKNRGEKGIGIGMIVKHCRDRRGNPVVRLITERTGTKFQRLRTDVWTPSR